MFNWQGRLKQNVTEETTCGIFDKINNSSGIFIKFFLSIHVLPNSLFQDSPACVSCAALQSCWSPSAGCLSPAVGSTWVDSSCHSNWPGPSPSTRARWVRVWSQPHSVLAATETHAHHITLVTALLFVEDIVHCCHGTPACFVGLSWTNYSLDEWLF